MNEDIVNELDDLMCKYKSDKGCWYHNYCRIYSMYLTVRKCDILKVLEIGIEEGKSLFAWRDFFPNAQIYGIDITKYSLINSNKDRITCLYGDATDISWVEKTIKPLGEFDLIVDDGSHISKDMITCLDFYFPNLLASGGIYILEDLNITNSKKSLIKRDPETITNYLFKLVSEMNWYDENCTCNDGEKYGSKPTNHWQSTLNFINFYRGIVILSKK